MRRLIEQLQQEDVGDREGLLIQRFKIEQLEQLEMSMSSPDQLLVAATSSKRPA
jgi:hypothetical protein